MYERQRKGLLKHLDFTILDLASLAGSFVLAYVLRHGTVREMFASDVYINTGIVLLIFDLLVILLFETMHNILRRGAIRELVSVVKENLIVFGCIAVYLFSVKDGDQLSRIVLWLTMLLHITSSFVLNILWKHMLVSRNASLRGRSILVVADSGMVHEVLGRFRAEPSAAYNVTGIVLADRDVDSGSIEGVPVVSSLQNAPRYICREWIDDVYVCTAMPPRQLIECCNEMGVTMHRELHTVGSDRQFVEKIAGKYVLTSAMKSATPGQMLAKRLIDIVGGLVGSLLAIIIIAIVGPQIKKASPGPILFKQERIGQNGKRFKMLKIRSMVLDADQKKQALMAQNRVNDGMMFKLDFDPRIIGNEILPDGTRKTGIGEFIRTTSLDEFPQFFNVLMGQMSLVGTRPPTLDEWEKYEFHHRRRLSVKPGVTGMWQISGRNKITDFEKVVKLDTDYINNWSLSLDFIILFKTIVSVLRRDGAL